MPPITAPYLLCVWVPIRIDKQGRRWTDELWAKDLALHVDYLSDLTLASPCNHQEPAVNDVCFDQPPLDRIKFVDLPNPRSYQATILSLPRIVLKLWRGVRTASIIHSGFAGWPISEACLCVPIGKIMKKYVITNVESAFWRTSGPGVSLVDRTRGFVVERLSMLFVKIADLRLFTSKAYAAEFLEEGAPRAFVVPATWVDEEWVLADDEAGAAWDAKSGPTRLIFAGRLIPEKGVNVLLSAIELAAAAGARLEITIVGDGPMRDQCQRTAQADHGTVSVRCLDPVRYGAAFP